MNDLGADTDEALMTRYSGGDLQAFEQLYARHKGPLFRYFKRQCDANLVKELYQDVWMLLVKARENYQVEAKFTTYLYRIAHNRLVDHYRSRGRQKETVMIGSSDDEEAFEPAASPQQQPDEVAHRGEQIAQFAVALEALPYDQREAFVLREEGRLTLEGIAATTNVGKETAKSRLRYAVSRLRAAMEEYR